MVIFIVILFILGYIGIALEHTIKINKAGIALVMGILLWVFYVMFLPEMVASHAPEAFALFVNSSPTIAALPFAEQCVKFIVQIQILEVLGEISETLFFLIGAMTIVEIIDVHGGFGIITNRITTRNKQTLLWVITITTFCLSAILDNMATAIVMVVLVNRIIPNYKERWIYASIIIIAANSGGAWSPIGDITTIMLWVKGNITADVIIPNLILPCIVSCLIPTYIASKFLKGVIDKSTDKGITMTINKIITRREKISVTIVGMLCLISVPIFKILTNLPPFMGILMALGVIWIYTEVMYKHKPNLDESLKLRVPIVLKRIDTSTILFFLGVLLSVSVLQQIDVLSGMAQFMDTYIHNVYVTNILIGLLSSIVDNVPLVAAAIGMYPLADASIIAASADPVYMANFVQNGIFWEFLAYCAGTGGSILIIGSVAGVVVMGIEHISFGWYFKHISLMALGGYIAGALVYMLQQFIF